MRTSTGTALVHAESNGAVNPATALDVLEETSARAQELGRATMGVTGEAEVPGLWREMRRSGVSIYPVVALGLLLVVDQLQGVAVTTLGPEIAQTLGLTPALLAALLVLKTIALALAALPVAALVQRRPRRALLSIVTAFAWAFMTLLTGFVTTPLLLLAVLVGDGASSASVNSLHPPLLFDSYPPALRVRILSIWNAALYATYILGPALVALLAGPLDLTWRGVMLALGIFSLLAAVVSVRLRDPGFGRWDTGRLRDAVHGREGQRSTATDDVSLGFFETVRRLLIIPTVRRVLLAYCVLGMTLIPLTTYLAFYFEQRWHADAPARGLFGAIVPIPAVIALLTVGRIPEAWFRKDPALLVRRTAQLIGTGMVATGVAVLSPFLWLMLAIYAVSTTAFAFSIPGLAVALSGIIRPAMRPHAAAMGGIALYAVGGFGGVALLGGLDQRIGVTAAIVALSVPGTIAAAVLHGAHRTINEDLARTIEDVVEEEELGQLLAGGARLPMLSCRRVNFSYGRLQVLFDVDFQVADGEMVALLGTNGAGKSTLLRVVSGLALPSSGTVRLDGRDVTYVDSERRVGLGIVQVAGGRGTFRKLTVVENLRAFGYTLGRDRRTIDAGIEETFSAFPRLAERRNQTAATLSGGESQMLALGAALIHRPRLLLIDELSLGLAPKTVGELLEMVRRINASGVAVVLVEQSVNIALSLVDRAYFMERGEVRFEGPARTLLERGDLVRSVFLEGALSGGAGSPEVVA